MEFSDRTDCVLRIAKIRCHAGMTVPHTLDLRTGDSILDLHLWNENLPTSLLASEPINGAIQFRARLRTSLSLLAAHIAAETDMADVKALRARIVLRRNDRAARYITAARQFGFTATLPRQSRTECLHNGFENLLLDALYRVFSCTRKTRPLALERLYLWISREDVLKRYAGQYAARTPISVPVGL